MDTKVTALIATLPKSGTWYSHTFFWCYDQLLQHADEYLAGNFKPDLLSALKNKNISNLSSHPRTLGLDKLYICHSVCPGFTSSNDNLKAEWEGLTFPLPYNWGEDYIRENDSWDMLTPAINPHARVVYLYRNPLDHFVSYYRHAQGHIDASHRTRMMPDGSRAPIENPQDFVFYAGMLGAFIKHYYSFRQMQLLYPEQILLIPYERCMLDPGSAFADILAFFGTPPDGPLKKRLFADALAMCSKESMMAIEAQMSGSLAGDQAGGEKHIRSGETGKWTKHFSEDDLEKIEAAFLLFGISLRDFNLFGFNAAGHNLTHLSQIDPVTLKQHQIAFLRQELMLAGGRLAVQASSAVNSNVLHQLKTKLFRMLKRSSFGPALLALRQRLRAFSSPPARHEPTKYTGKKFKFR